MEGVYWKLFLRVRSRRAERQFPWADAGWHQYVIGSQRGCADNEGKRKGRKGEVVDDGDKGSVSTQGRREQMKEERGDVSEGH